jgi:hypothetical protein
VTSSDGIDATLRWGVGPVRNASQVFYGHSAVTLIEPLHVYGRGGVGISNTSDWGALSVRANVVSAEISSDIGAELFGGFDAFGPIGQALTRRYAMDHKRMTLANIGVNYDPGAWFVMAEAGRTVSHSFLGSTRSAYVSAGWRWHAFTPYATYARVRAAGATTEPGLPVAALPPALAVDDPATDVAGGGCALGPGHEHGPQAAIRPRDAAGTLARDLHQPDAALHAGTPGPRGQRRTRLRVLAWRRSSPSACWARPCCSASCPARPRVRPTSS